MRRSLLAVIALTTSADADDAPREPQSRAQALYEEGSRHYKLHEYDAAIAAFKQAYAMFPEPTILFDLGQAYRQLDDCKDALSFYKTYLHDKPDAEDRALVEKLVSEMQACVDEQSRVAAAPAPAPAPVVVAPPRYRGLRVAGIVTGGVGALVAASGIYFSYDASHQASLLEQMCTTKCAATDVAAIDRKGKESQTDAITLYAIGGSIAAIGTGMFVYAVLHADPETVTVTPTAGGAAVSARFHF